VVALPTVVLDPLLRRGGVWGPEQATNKALKLLSAMAPMRMRRRYAVGGRASNGGNVRIRLARKRFLAKPLGMTPEVSRDPTPAPTATTAPTRPRSRPDHDPDHNHD
jgi:hypothetical protein